MENINNFMEIPIPQKIIAALNILALELSERDDRLIVLGVPPSWAEQEFDCLEDANIAFEANLFSPFLENFLIDAEALWKEGSEHLLRSGIWTEPGRSGREMNLEAIALFIDGRRIILVELSQANDVEKFEWLQKARQENLDFISERKIAETKLQSAMLNDALTGLPNRAFFLSQLETCFEQSQWPKKGKFAVAVLNLDRFKMLNLSLGTTASDRILAIVANQIRYSLRRNDVPVRFGADEFGILLYDVTSREDVLNIVRRIQQKLCQPLEIYHHRLELTACLGVAISDEGYRNARDLLRDASIAMHEAKALGSNKYVLFNRRMRIRALEVWSLEADLRKAIEEEQLEIWYQPIVSLETQHVTGFEALLRWQHPTQGWISPAKFIPLAEKTGLIYDLDRWVFRKVCQTIQNWGQQANGRTCVNINLSALHFTNTNLLGSVREILSETDIDPNQVRLEITESEVLTDTQFAAQVLGRLKSLGLEIAIDDFGMGYASFNYLQDLPVDKLKIDGYFTETMLTHGSDIVSTIIDLAHRLGIEVTAEQIETAEQLALLKYLGCDTAQGYLFSRPVTEAEARSWIDAKMPVA